MLCSDGEVAESSLLLCKFKEAYVASTCLVLSQLFEGGAWSAGCVSTEDCKSNNLITARSSKYFYRTNSVSAGNYRIIDP